MPVETIVLFLVGFFILLKGARILIDGASSIARIFNISDWVVGVVIVGIGTSIPEFSITISSVIRETPIGLGTILGSNIFNILVILGLTAIIAPITVKKHIAERDVPVNVFLIGLAILLLLFPILGPIDFVGISRPEGLILLAMFCVWLWYMVRRKHTSRKKTDYKVFAFTTSVIMIIGGIAGVFLGGHWVVNGAEVFALTFGISEGVVGLLILGVGTSVSELVVSISAIFKRESNLALGNIVGSNVFDMVGIFGITTLFKPITMPHEMSTDALMTFGVAALLLLALFVGKKHTITRTKGAIFITCYIIYATIIVW